MVYPQLAPADGNTRERSVLGPSVRLFDCSPGLRLPKHPGWAEIPPRQAPLPSGHSRCPPVLTGGDMRCSRLFGEVGHYAPEVFGMSNDLAASGNGPVLAGMGWPPRPGARTSEHRRKCRPPGDSSPWACVSSRAGCHASPAARPGLAACLQWPSASSRRPAGASARRLQ